MPRLPTEEEKTEPEKAAAKKAAQEKDAAFFVAFYVTRIARLDALIDKALGVLEDGTMSSQPEQVRRDFAVRELEVLRAMRADTDYALRRLV